MGSPSLNTKLCDQSTPQILTSHPKSFPICTPSMDTPKLWSNKITRNSLYTSPPIPEEQKRRIQKIIGTFIYYARDVDCTILPAINTLSEQQSSPTKNMEAAITHFLEYASTNPSVIIQYKASDMTLHIDNDASYPSEPRARSRTWGHFYLSSLPTDPKKYPNLPPPANGPIHTVCRILKHVVASAAEEEVGGLFHNGKTDVPLIITLR